MIDISTHKIDEYNHIIYVSDEELDNILEYINDYTKLSPEILKRSLVGHNIISEDTILYNVKPGHLPIKIKPVRILHLYVSPTRKFYIA